MKKLLLMVLMIVILAGCKAMEGKDQGEQFTGQLNPAQTAEKINMQKEFVKANPKEVKGWIELGNLQMDASQYAAALETYSKALEFDPENVDVIVDRGTCYRETGKPDIAEKEYIKAIKVNPNHAIAHYNLGIVLAFDLKDRDGAIKAFEIYIKLKPDAPGVPQIQQMITDLKAGNI